VKWPKNPSVLASRDSPELTPGLLAVALAAVLVLSVVSPVLAASIAGEQQPNSGLLTTETNALGLTDTVTLAGTPTVAEMLKDTTNGTTGTLTDTTNNTTETLTDTVDGTTDGDITTEGMPPSGNRLTVFPPTRRRAPDAIDRKGGRKNYAARWTSNTTPRTTFAC